MFQRPREGGPLINYGHTQCSGIKGEDTRVQVTPCHVQEPTAPPRDAPKENVANVVPKPTDPQWDLTWDPKCEAIFSSNSWAPWPRPWMP